MPGFFQRLRLSRGRVSHSGAARAVEEKRRRREDFEDDYPDEEAPGRNRIPSLPVLTDNGPYSNIRYISEGLFWNSALTEAGKGERIQVRSDHSTSKRRHASHATEHKSRWTALRKQQEEASYQKDLAKFTQLQEDAARQHAYENRGLGRIDRAKIIWGRERADNDRMIMSYCIPLSPGPPTVPMIESKRAPIPLSPSTREWDEFMDFETHEPADSFQQPVPELRYGDHRDKELPATPEPPLWYETAYQPRLSQTSLVETTLNTDATREGTIDHTAADHENGNVPQNVASQTATTNGTGSDDNTSSSTVTEKTVQSSMIPDLEVSVKETQSVEHASKPPLTNGVHYKTTSFDQDEHSSQFVNRSPSPDPPYNSSTPLNEISGSHGSSTEKTSNEPSPQRSHASSTGLQTLLRTLLSPSELSLFNASAPSHLDASPSDPSICSKTPRPLQSRLTSKCHALLQHLHDCNRYSEDIVISSISEALERKAFAVDLLNFETAEHSKQIIELRRVIDFSNKILAGCWDREFEMYRTLATIRQERRKKGVMGVLRRWSGKGKEERLDEGLLSPAKQVLKQRELDAIMLMAEQNVVILREDADEMTGRVDKLKVRFRGNLVHKEVVPGSWRDV